jgi:hypothetical protein
MDGGPIESILRVWAGLAGTKVVQQIGQLLAVEAEDQQKLSAEPRGLD